MAMVIKKYHLRDVVALPSIMEMDMDMVPAWLGAGLEEEVGDTLTLMDTVMDMVNLVVEDTKVDSRDLSFLLSLWDIMALTALMDP